MKKAYSFIFVLAAAFILSGFIFSSHSNPENKDKMPENVKAIVDKSCFGCHNSGSKNEDAKEALDFKKLDKLSLIKKISAYKQIEETVVENEMPPKRFLEKQPEKKLSEEEKKILVSWAKKEAETLVKSAK